MAAPYNPPQEGYNPAYAPPSAQNESHEQAFPEPVKPQDQQYAGQVPPPGQPGGYYVHPQDAERNNSHLLIAWILFAVGFIVPLVWIVGLFIPCCRRPRWTKGTFIAWLLSLTALIVYAGILAAVIVVVVKNGDDNLNCDGYYRFGVFRCF